MRIRKYFRGSGRVLAFVFIASVIWLLFDMAALRVSFSEVNPQLLKELIVKEREALKHQATTRTPFLKKRGPKLPQQKSDMQRLNEVQFAFKVDEQAGGRAADAAQVKQDLQLGPDKKAARENKDSELKRAHKNAQSDAKLHAKVQVKWPKDLITNTSIRAAPIAVNKQENIAKQGMHVRKEAISDTQKGIHVPSKASVKIPKELPKAPPGAKEEELHLTPKPGKKSPHTTGASKLVVVDKSKNNVLDTGATSEIKADEKAHPKESQAGDDNSLQVKVKEFPKMDKSKDQQSNISIPVNKKEVSKERDGGPGMGKISVLNVKEAGGEVKVNSTVRVRDSGTHKVLHIDVTQHPRDAKVIGQFGQPAEVAKDKEVQVMKMWNEGYFNVYLSEQIPLDRAIPDTRPQGCSEMLVHNDLPTTSVIFCFVDEVWSTLLRSVHSVLNRSPPHLLKEIILVDDFSTKDYLKEKLDEYMSQFPKVRIVRLKERQGLIRARLAGAAVATGEVLTFLDSHIECNVGWLEPLLERVYLDRRKVAIPVIEVISDKDLSYMLVDNFQRGIFKWPLVFGWKPIPEEIIKRDKIKDSDPLRCPVMAGGLFSIDKKYFYELGTYDPGLDVWGGENMEISFKIWMCGGEMEIIPCSRVGHIFRNENPYKFPKDRQKTVERNLVRVAEVWLDEYKDLFYGHGYHHLLNKNNVEVGDLSEQIQLRKNLKCKSFKWYLENIYPDLEAPLVKAEGLIFNLGARKCLVVEKEKLSFEVCDLSRQNQHFNHTWLRHVRQQNVCLALKNAKDDVGPVECDRADPQLRWLHKSHVFNPPLLEHLILEHLPQPACLEADRKGVAVLLRKCDPGSPFQKWQFTNYYAE
ncbi:GALT5 acetylgalactosaminyltransferase, partial [Amia calva]|nr:GALT5 acetylgalactosaminyltransferase [Amia calva]